MRLQCIHDLTEWLQSTRGVAGLVIQPELCPADMTGDITINCFRMIRELKGNPLQLAQQVTDFLAKHPDVEQVESVKAFVNLTVRKEALFRDTIADETALLDSPRLPEELRRRYLVEYSAPNTNKPMHLGHVRNNTLGQANCGILSAVGHDVVQANLVNDRGVHICKSMVAYQLFGNGITPEAANMKGDRLVGDFYVKYATEEKRQQEAGEVDAQGTTMIETQAQAMLLAWEAGDLRIRALWQKMNGWVLEGFARTYARMGISFRQTYFESETFRMGKDSIRLGLEKGVFYRRDDGAIEIDLTSRKLDKKVVLRPDGTSVYVTQDIGTTLMKREDFRPEVMVWIVGDEQIYHFKVLFAILEEMGYPWAAECRHLAYGMVNLPTGRMKSREGTVVDADDLFDELARLARIATMERWADNPPADIDQRAEAIGLGAIKFMLLKVSPRTTMIFDPEASIKFEGDTGPYVLYAYARTASVLRKAEDTQIAEADIDWSLLGEPEERALALRLALYGQAMQQAAADLDPSKLADYLLQLAKEFSRFWKEQSVLQASSPALIRTRLALCARVRIVLRAGLKALAIEPLEAM